jgi:hypothetical protein
MRPRVVIVGYLVASFAAATAFLIPNSIAAFQRHGVGELLVITVFFWGMITLFAFIPAIGFILYAEDRRIRSIWYYTISGAATGLVSFTITGLPFIGRAFGNSDGSLMTFAFFASAGAVGGLTYWAIGGRRANAWQNASATPPHS